MRSRDAAPGAGPFAIAPALLPRRPRGRGTPRVVHGVAPWQVGRRPCRPLPLGAARFLLPAHTATSVRRPRAAFYARRAQPQARYARTARWGKACGPWPAHKRLPRPMTPSTRGSAAFLAAFRADQPAGAGEGILQEGTATRSIVLAVLQAPERPRPSSSTAPFDTERRWAAPLRVRHAPRRRGPVRSRHLRTTRAVPSARPALTTAPTRAPPSWRDAPLTRSSPWRRRCATKRPTPGFEASCTPASRSLSFGRAAYYEAGDRAACPR